MPWASAIASLWTAGKVIFRIGVYSGLPGEVVNKLKATQEAATGIGRLCDHAGLLYYMYTQNYASHYWVALVIHNDATTTRTPFWRWANKHQICKGLPNELCRRARACCRQRYSTRRFD